MNPKTAKPQGWKNIIQFISPYFLVVGTCQLIGLYIAGLDIKSYRNVHETSQQLFSITFFGFVGTWLIVWLFRKYVDKKTFLSLGFEKRFIKKDVSIGLILGFSIMLMGFVYLLLSNQIEFVNFRIST